MNTTNLYIIEKKVIRTRYIGFQGMSYPKSRLNLLRGRKFYFNDVQQIRKRI